LALLGRFFGKTFHEQARRQSVTIEEGHFMKDHVHMCQSIAPKLTVLNVAGQLKGKSYLNSENLKGRQRNFTGEALWARGYFVSTVGLDEAMVREYIRNKKIMMSAEIS